MKQFLEILEQKNIPFTLQEPMGRHTTFRIGGNADVFVSVSSPEQLKTVLSAAKENRVPTFCLGRGSNLLVSDDGIEGAVISLGEMCEIHRNGNRITCEAGTPLSALCLFARDESLSGLEFAYGIPGSVGGALFMNAGAYGGEMAQVVTAAIAIDPDEEEHILMADQMAFGYRTSIFRENGWIITYVTVELAPGDKTKITEKMEDLMGRRKAKQPLEFPSAGSTFKRPTGFFAGALIEENGLKGAAVGDAQVSEKHAGFIINRGNATAEDVCGLIAHVQDVVQRANGVLLEPEVIFVGRHSDD